MKDPAEVRKESGDVSDPKHLAFIVTGHAISNKTQTDGSLRIKVSVDFRRPVGTATERKSASDRREDSKMREMHRLPRTEQKHTLPLREPDRRQDEVNATVSS